VLVISAGRGLALNYGWARSFLLYTVVGCALSVSQLWSLGRSPFAVVFGNGCRSEGFTKCCIGTVTNSTVQCLSWKAYSRSAGQEMPNGIRMLICRIDKKSALSLLNPVHTYFSDIHFNIIHPSTV
jgi:hypothetical protein